MYSSFYHFRHEATSLRNSFPATTTDAEAAFPFLARVGYSDHGLEHWAPIPNTTMYRLGPALSYCYGCPMFDLLLQQQKNVIVRTAITVIVPPCNAHFVAPCECEIASRLINCMRSPSIKDKRYLRSKEGSFIMQVPVQKLTCYQMRTNPYLKEQIPIYKMLMTATCFINRLA